MPYRVRGYPYLQTARPQGTAAQLDAGKVDLADVRPALLAGLERVGEQLRRRVTIFSGYRTSAYSQQVGGFAGDPHSQAIAVDAEVDGRPIGNVPRALRLLRAQGLVSGAQPGFYRGAPDPAHVQLPGAGSSPSVNLEQLWTQAGGPANVARTMAAIALAESGGRVSATHKNADGSVDRGLWQINSSHAAYDPARLVSDPLYNARAAVAVYRSQGLGAWTTYSSGAYRQYLQRAPGAVAAGVAPGTVPRTRPGGETTAGGNELAAWQDYLNPTEPFGPLGPALGFKPLLSFTGAADAIGSGLDFLKWVAWLFHPRNLLRMVEFTAGSGLIVLGVWTSVKAFEGGPAPEPTRAAARALELTPQGRALKATRAGKRQAREHRRREEFRSTRAKARTKENTRLSNRAFEREAKRSGKGPGSEIPF